MTTRVLLSLGLVFVLASCSSHTEDEQKPEVPKALEDKSSFQILSKRRTEGDMVENLYDELSEKDTVLTRLNKAISDLSGSKIDSAKLFNNYNDKIQQYYRSANSALVDMKDTLLRDKLKQLVKSRLSEYESRVKKHHALLETMDSTQGQIEDLYIMLKILKTMPLIQKYQQDHLPDTRQLQGYIQLQQPVLHLVDSLVHK